MRDMYFTLTILNNKLNNKNDIYSFTEIDIENLRNIKSKDLIYSFYQCLDLINSYLTDELKNYYNNNFENYKNK